MRLHHLALVTFAICQAAGCDLTTEEEVKVLLPAPPASWQIAFPELRFRVVTRDARNRVQEKDVGDWRRTAAVTCARSVNSPILAYAWESGLDADLRPAGGFYPLSLRAFQGSEVLELTWEDGAAAYVMSRVAAQGRDVSRFNVARLRRFLQEHTDPWALDLDAVAQKVSRGELTAWDIDELPCRDAEVEPGPGTWFLESPFSSSFESVNGRCLLTGVSLGCHHLFALDGKSWRMEIGKQETVLIRMK
ncbi:MAG: hypothetical protein ABSG21_04550 [Spirochaetia bacterium]|jgi:hypothetical protein